MKKIAHIFEELAKNPFEGVGKPEALKHELSGLWSREINKKDSVLYRVKEEICNCCCNFSYGTLFR